METDKESEDNPSDGIGGFCENIFTDKEHLEEEPNRSTVKNPLRIRPIKVVLEKPKPTTKADEDDKTPLSKALTWSTHKNVEIDLHKDSIKPAGAIPHILHVHYFKGNGNCGFRAVVVSLGHQSDKWDSISEEMQKEFESNKAYSDQRFLDNVWGAGDNQKDITNSLAWRDKEHQAPLKYWMTFPAHD
ncbi:uncharacterized protein PGTG_18649 [Puccinia graminis f. sp. tritici CRL 75-36-700-3]|uniref:OTU domain-containing protein n=1 Tax=Puccinia graminis f. sp. tritici (strain CRL 75-36-700-3 / race SCCL) TaxID=418459 RepID=E3L890_PUCGT|nr:uncharacterized protein PGTG_18649 [Puccinia graminis f. sp. tritici CRL 75-36-700-3]EFP92765.2 hypothetical protein PGTG_18649 [Puccinia graminis f. sp. tritici CRL 75-36-700-3]